MNLISMWRRIWISLTSGRCVWHTGTRRAVQEYFRKVVDESKNSGLPDTFVPASLSNQFLEYQFTANNLDLFTGYTIKIVMSGTNQAYPPRLKELRTIAIR